MAYYKRLWLAHTQCELNLILDKLSEHTELRWLGGDQINTPYPLISKGFCASIEAFLPNSSTPMPTSGNLIVYEIDSCEEP